MEDCTTTNKIWENLAQIHGGDKNVLRAKAESLRGKFDGMIMKGETIAQYYGQIKLWMLEEVMEESYLMKL